MNIRGNKLFKELFESIKNRFDVGGEEDSTLYSDMIEAINNMITAIELGKSDEAFVGLFLPKMNRVYDEKLAAPAAIAIKDNCVTLFMNPQLLFMICEDYDDFLVIITHEIYHLVFKHLIPSRNYPNHDRTNIAMDTSVNQHICNISPHLAKQIYTLENFNKEFNVKAEEKREFEYYYDLIPDDYNQSDPTLQKMLNDLYDKKEKQKNNPSKENQQAVDEQKKKIKDYLKENYVLGDIGQGTPMNNSLADQLIMEDLIEGTINEAKSRGKIPGGMEEVINDLYFKNPIISWKKELRNILGSVPCPYRKTMRVKNRRMPSRADLLGKVNDRKINITIAIDTSGSVTDDELKYFFNEVFNIIKDIKTEITLIQCDAEVKSVTKITKKEDVKKVKTVGRGGTYFTPVFEKIKDMNKIDYPNVVIFCTDGYGEANIPIELKPKAEILWVLTGYNNNLSVQNEAFRKKIRLLNIEGKKYL